MPKTLGGPLYFAFFALIAWGLPTGVSAAAEAPVTIAADIDKPGAAIPEDFSGLSYEIADVLPKAPGEHIFSPENRRLVSLFRTLGIRSLRIGGNTADKPQVGIPGPADIDALFRFAEAADARVIYTVRLKNGDPAADARIGRYLMDRYRSRLAALAIGNEPNFYFTAYESYRVRWKEFADALAAAAPGIPLCGPSVEPAKWLQGFASDFGPSGRASLLVTHKYFGGAGGRVLQSAAEAAQLGQAGGDGQAGVAEGKRKITPAQGRALLLSRDMVAVNFTQFFKGFVPRTQACGLPYRLEEANSFYNGGAAQVSDTFASALWALDLLHWWSEHGAAGVNFHTGDNVAAGQRITSCKYAAFVTSPDGYRVRPQGYGIKAFDLGGRGRSVPLRLGNQDGINVTAYGVLAVDGSLRVTIVNKEYGPSGRAARVSFASGGFSAAEQVLLQAPGGDIAATSGVTLGGAAIGEDGSWAGKWTPVISDPQGSISVTVPAATAAIVRILIRRG